MGGDVLYAVPKTAARPGEREMTLRGRVAHTRAETASKPEEPATAASNEPVVPLGAPVPAPAPAPAGAADAGAGPDAVARGDAGR